MGANKAKGTRFESEIRDELRAMGYDVETLRTTGKLDEGDLIVREEDLYCLIEAKNQARMDLAGFLAQALDERANYSTARGMNPDRVFPVVIIKRRGKGIRDAYVVTTFEEFFK